MAKREVATQYVGSAMGFIWTFIHPMVLICVLWVVFSLGFRVRPVDDAPFVVWLTAGMCGWFVFSDILGKSANVIIANANLIKKTLFPSQILPIVAVVSSFIAHSLNSVLSSLHIINGGIMQNKGVVVRTHRSLTNCND